MKEKKKSNLKIGLGIVLAFKVYDVDFLPGETEKVLNAALKDIKLFGQPLEDVEVITKKVFTKREHSNV